MVTGWRSQQIQGEDWLEAEEKRMAEQPAPTGVRRKNQEEEKTKHDARTAPDGRDENGDSGKQFENSCV
jgi:hypothetical protein